MTTSTPAGLHRRLLHDIAEIQQDPYPNVHLHINPTDITTTCLILTPSEHEQPLHLTITFPDNYPLRAPSVTIQSAVDHPNVFNNYICASMLNTAEGWTPAYTLKGIVIQLLSFFSSEVIEQDYGGVVELSTYRAESRAHEDYRRARHQHYCSTCGFGASWTPQPPPPEEKKKSVATSQQLSRTTTTSKLFDLPDEVILLLLSHLPTSDILSLSSALPTIAHMLHSYDFIRIRELQCFVLKKSFLATNLGIGISLHSSSGGKRAVFRSEFDLLSASAFTQFRVRKSIQGVPFTHWLPLPLSQRHWNAVRRDAALSLEKLHAAARLEGSQPVDVLFHFMTTIVVQFSADADRPSNAHAADARSTLTHASEKAVDSYFALFHLLLCLATEDPVLITSANRTVVRFLAGPRGKAHFPDLGHLLVAALLSDAGLTETLVFHIIKEAVLRNVVWMLDARGAGHAELAYLEPGCESDYRLSRTFEAGRTSYRLLMFLKLFSSTARTPDTSLAQLRDALFATHGAPPPGTSAAMARQIRQIRAISEFPGFLEAMGISEMPTKDEFGAFLKRSVEESVDAGYSVMPMTQSQLFMIRRVREPSVDASAEVEITPALERWFEMGEKWYRNGWEGRPSFFPGRGGNGGRGRGRGRGGWRGRRGG